MHTRRVVVAGVALCALFMSVEISNAAASEGARELARPLAEMTLGASRVDWQPAGDFASLVLTVTGPDGAWIRKELKAGQPPSLSIDEHQFPDGTYVYELRFLKGDWKVPERPLLQAGSFAVRDGSFVSAIEARRDPREVRAVTEPQVRNITAAAEVVPDDLVVQGNACMGGDCGSGDANGPQILRLKSSYGTGILFEDIYDGISFDRDWSLQANPFIGGPDHFFLKDVDAGTTPFSVQGAAPDSALVVASSGKIGLGTATPGAQLHLYQGTTSDATVGMGPDPSLGPAFNIGYSGSSFGRGSGFLNVRPDASATAPNPSLRLLTANVERMIVTNTGNVGIGTTSPSTQLHVRDTTTRGKIFAENANGTTTPRELLEIRNNGGAVFILDDTSVSERWALGTSGSSIVMDNQAAAGTELTLTSTGNMTIAGTLTQNSDRDSKRDIVSVHPEEILAKVATLPIATWNRKVDPPSVRHLGPMAQDFAAAFGLGDNERQISTLDMAGVSLASIQALYRMVSETTAQKDEEIGQLKSENADLSRRLAALEALVQAQAGPSTPRP
jgi:hypothetical protein